MQTRAHHSRSSSPCQRPSSQTSTNVAPTTTMSSSGGPIVTTAYGSPANRQSTIETTTKKNAPPLKPAMNADIDIQATPSNRLRSCPSRRAIVSGSSPHAEPIKYPARCVNSTSMPNAIPYPSAV